MVELSDNLYYIEDENKSYNERGIKPNMITQMLENRDFALKFDGGVVNGKQKTKTRTFQNVKNDATKEAIHATGTALASLQESSLLSVYIKEVHALLEE